ncbi:hypothetical protein [Bradyrhizobium ottawaense]|uniref:hypothetical protein n=1 Tax=Bradyrhizobium ottawaense TaxID=931866 RepID=UPI0027D71F7B|nr:hypothetical protein BwSG10_48590 [Bradyrhizobium ottawaense]GMP00668.1 hypothetical protein BwSH20_29630 [Bradyrhizobium ottawaense]GMP05460.1 hypothetical protein BwDG23_48590 [Bradyrhizobium ottawaense]GMP21113.1 hypothetical protein BwSH12_71200 [Bradyrhizobium ottawaense]
MSQPAPNTTHTIDLPYEIDHLRAAYRLLPQFGPQNKHLNNLIIEGFWLHARNLLEMFLGKRNATDPKLIAPNYQPKDTTKMRDYYAKICNQITHLQDGRPVADAGKLDCQDVGLITWLEDEIAHFLGQVDPSLRSSLGPQQIGYPMGPQGPTPSATNSPIAHGWTGPAGGAQAPHLPITSQTTSVSNSAPFIRNGPTS